MYSLAGLLVFVRRRHPPTDRPVAIIGRRQCKCVVAQFYDSKKSLPPYVRASYFVRLHQLRGGHDVIYITYVNSNIMVYTRLGHPRI